MIPEILFYAIAIGLIPALLWLWIWLREDSEHPEPRYMIAISFLAGMIMAPLAALIQITLQNHIGTHALVGTTAALFILVAVAIEEILKFAGSFFALKNKKVFDEPIDAMIYLITTALGFVAVENTLYALQAITHNGLVEDGVINGFTRFLGPSLLHIVTSGILGLALSFGFYLRKRIKRLYIYIGLFTAIVLHAGYNFFIIINTPETTTYAFTLVWVLAVLLVVLFEIVKRIKK